MLDRGLPITNPGISVISSSFFLSGELLTISHAFFSAKILLFMYTWVEPSIGAHWDSSISSLLFQSIIDATELVTITLLTWFLNHALITFSVPLIAGPSTSFSSLGSLMTKGEATCTTKSQSSHAFSRLSASSRSADTSSRSWEQSPMPSRSGFNLSFLAASLTVPLTKLWGVEPYLYIFRILGRLLQPMLRCSQWLQWLRLVAYL